MLFRSEDGTYEYLTQGDNNSEPDSLYVRFDQVIGVELFVIPKVGKVQFLIANQKAWLILLLVPVIIYLLRDFNKMLDLFSLRNKITKMQAKEEEEKEQKIEQEQERKEELKKRLVEKNNYHSVILSSELDSKISEYDKKLAELNKMIENIDDLAKQKEETVIIDDSFLKESKLKVTDSYSTKDKVDTKKSESKPKKQTKKLNLNPKEVKKINRPEYQVKKVEDEQNIMPKEDKKVKKSSKKITKKVVKQPKKVLEKSEEKTSTKPKAKIITIEKVRKKK